MVLDATHCHLMVQAGMLNLVYILHFLGLEFAVYAKNRASWPKSLMHDEPGKSNTKMLTFHS